VASLSQFAKLHAERLVYRAAGLPIALSALWIAVSGADGGDAFPFDLTFASQFWHPQGASDFIELLIAAAALPIALPASIAWFTLRNGPEIRRRSGKSLSRQVRDQLRLYASAGVLPPWYYVFSLHDDSRSERARTFLQRFETKPFIFPRLKPRRGSPLNDKAEFAEFCSAKGIACVETLMVIDGSVSGDKLPDRDLFIKRNKGRGGRGAERWDRVAPNAFKAPGGETLSGSKLASRLAAKSRISVLIVQPRLIAHSALNELTTGALPTVRVVTCLDERGEPELIGAVFRMAIGGNVTVDNLHAGGIAAAVDLESGCLSRATNLGSDARLGWLSHHPDTGAQVQGRALPLWGQTKDLAVAAHELFNDRVVIGWDIAILEDGPILVEGNGNPDMDIIQRFMPTGLRAQRFGELLNHHLQLRDDR
jgi:hypothetical protein